MPRLPVPAQIQASCSGPGREIEVKPGERDPAKPGENLPGFDRNLRTDSRTIRERGSMPQDTVRNNMQGAYVDTAGNLQHGSFAFI